ncbi:MAG: amidohydrolase family protein, partial [Lewinella sp.]|nr:amidohydrolase family protein [Lewinella sp.]
MTIDAHQHFWTYQPNGFEWITDEMATIRRNFWPEDLGPVLASCGIDGSVLVQVSQEEAENERFLAYAEAHPFIKGTVGWIDLKAATARERIAHYAARPLFKGARHILQAEAPGFMTDPAFVRGVRLLREYDLTYDILTTEVQLPEVVRFVRALPEMRLVIDHISKPDIRAGSIDEWSRYMRELSAMEHVHVKLSGMVTEANWREWSADTLRPYVDHCLEHFGPARLMYGSDWPVCLVAGTYEAVHTALQDCIAELSVDERAQIMGGT